MMNGQMILWNIMQNQEKKVGDIYGRCQRNEKDTSQQWI